MFDYLFFDLDGTLTDPARGITNSFIYALKYFKIEIPPYEKLLSFIGPPLADTFIDNFDFPKEKVQVAIKKYREYFATKGLFENKVYDGIIPLLQKLKNHQKRLIVATSKPEVYSVQILKKFNLFQYFDFICGSDIEETRSKKSQIIEYAIHKVQISDKTKVLMIGDREYDIFGAIQNGIKSCGVTFGYGSKIELQNANADFIAENICELEKICLK